MVLFVFTGLERSVVGQNVPGAQFNAVVSKSKCVSVIQLIGMHVGQVFKRHVDFEYIETQF